MYKRQEEGLRCNGVAAQKACLDEVVNALPWEALQQIFHELGRLLLWGQHLLFRPRAASRMPELEHRCTEALERFRCGDRQGFVEAVAGSYDDSFRWVRSFLCASGLWEAGELRGRGEA